jgi:hypothetical protein
MRSAKPGVARPPLTERPGYDGYNLPVHSIAYFMAPSKSG